VLPAAQSLFPSEPAAPARPRADALFPAAAAPAPAASPWNLDLIQQHAGPGQITSAGRSAQRNAAVGGSKTSSHLTGDAFDFVPKDRNTKRAAAALAAAGVPYDQIIDEGDHVHIGWGPKMRGQFMPRKGALPSAADLFKPESYVGRVGRRGNEGVAQMREGLDRIVTNDLGGAIGDPGETLGGVMDVVGGGIKAIAAPVSGYIERAAGPAWQAATGGPQSSAGDISDNLLALATPGPKAAKVAGRARPVAMAAEAAPAAEDLFPAIEAAKGRATAADIGARDKILTEIDALKSQAALDKPLADTRGRGVQYHGARGPISKLEEGYSNHDNIYGGFETFYTTDAADVAKGYGRKSENSQIYEVTERKPVKFYDMEARHDADHWAQELGVKPDDFGFEAEALDEAVSNAKGTPNLREIMDEMRASSKHNGYSKSDVQEIFDSITYNLGQKGYGGMRHTGGLKTGRTPHEVKIYFKPHEQLDIAPEASPAPPNCSPRPWPPRSRIRRPTSCTGPAGGAC
jgi:hypothetical protein